MRGDFKEICDKTIQREGGFILHSIEGDSGGDTFAGISRVHHTDWYGWILIERSLGETKNLDDLSDENPNKYEIKSYVYALYEQKFWEKIRGDQIKEKSVCESIFDFSVNSGINNATLKVQQLVSEKEDGILGPKTLKALNDYCNNPEKTESFLVLYTVLKINFYTEICRKKTNQKKFLLGWVKRALSLCPTAIQ